MHWQKGERGLMESSPAENSAAQIRLGVPETTLEAVGPGVKVAGARVEVTFIFSVGNNLGEFDFDELRIGGLTTEAAKRLASIFDSALLDIVSRGVRKEEDTSEEDQAPGELDANWDSVTARVSSVLDGIVDA